jgi:hypothetical protein
MLKINDIDKLTKKDIEQNRLFNEMKLKATKIIDNIERIKKNTPSSPSSPGSPGSPGSPVSSDQTDLNKTDSESKFRMNVKRLFITIKGHPKKDYIDFINEKYPVKFWCYGNEISDSGHKYVHSHFVIEFEKKINIKNSRALDYNGVHPDLQPVRNWDEACCYCCKQYREALKSNKDALPNFETNLIDFDPFKIEKQKKSLDAKPIKAILDDINKCQNVQDAILNNAKDLKDVIPIISMYNNRGYIMNGALLNRIKQTPYLDWHKDLLELLHSDPDCRQINWIFDEKGNTGKTLFCDKYEVDNLHDALVIASIGSLRDIADVIRNWMTSNSNEPRTILFDLPRTLVDRDSIYTLLESIKNGRLTCTKYSGTTLRFERPHIIVFANWLPKLGLISRDRWNIEEIRNKKLVKYVPNENDDKLDDSGLDAFVNKPFSV